MSTGLQNSAVAPSVPAVENFPGLDPARVAWIASILPETPSAGGAPISDRAAWGVFAEANPDVLERARVLLAEPPPRTTEELYLLYSRTGSRMEYEALYRQRILRLSTFCLAECIEDRGNFLEAFKSELRDLHAEPTWIIPAHDNHLDSYYGRVAIVDLGVAMRAATIATGVAWLRERIPAELYDETLREIDRRVFQPYYTALRAPRSEEGIKACRWIEGITNWNAVCTSGIVVAVAAMHPSREARAIILAGAEKYVPNYLAGFTADGYCSEGLGYWNYGFSHYVLFAEAMLRATSGAIDFYKHPIVRAIASFPFNLEMAPGIYPSFADCELYPEPTRWLQDICDARLFSPGGGSGHRIPPTLPLSRTGQLYFTAITGFPLTSRHASGDEGHVALDPARGWFKDAGILISRIPDRPGDNSTKLSVALKGGHNAEHHNHNDVGSYAIALNGRLLVADPGKEEYTSKTFSPQRYTIEIINSSGHPVPVIAGTLQSPGAEARAVMLDAVLTPGADTLKLDLASAYAVPTLHKLERTFHFSRAGRGSLTIEDVAEFATPESYESVIIIHGVVEQQGEHAWLIRDETGTALQLTIDTHGASYETTTRPIDTTNIPAPLRFSINLKSAAEAVGITFKFEAVD